MISTLYGARQEFDIFVKKKSFFYSDSSHFHQKILQRHANFALVC